MYKERKGKNTLKNKSGQEALKRNNRAYTVRLLQLQPMMATHAEKSRKNLEFWIQKSVQTLEKEIKLQMSLSNPCPFHISYCRMRYPLIKYGLSSKII